MQLFPFSYLNRIHIATFLPFRAYNTDNQLIIDTWVKSPFYNIYTFGDSVLRVNIIGWRFFHFFSQTTPRTRLTTTCRVKCRAREHLSLGRIPMPQLLSQAFPPPASIRVPVFRAGMLVCRTNARVVPSPLPHVKDVPSLSAFAARSI